MLFDAHATLFKLNLSLLKTKGTLAEKLRAGGAGIPGNRNITSRTAS
jgi:acyl CoA:acetate/3-ketoacid CoA transferase alpha subunit